MKHKQYEVVTCECGKECPVDYSVYAEDGQWTCVDCRIEYMKELLESKLKKINKLNNKVKKLELTYLD